MVLPMKHVVVIDDDETIAGLFAAFLNSAGFCAQIATSALAGIRLVRETTPAAVVCDVRMPGGGGDEVIAALKSEPSTAEIPVVLVTGYIPPATDADALLMKPVRCLELISTVEELAA